MKYKSLFLIPYFLLIVITASCQEKELQNKEVYLVIQPELELNKSTNFAIYFKEKPDEGSLRMDPISNAKLAVEVNGENQWQISTTNIDENGKKVAYYALDNYITATKLGNVTIPEVTVKIKGEIYRSKPFVVKVVDKVNVNDRSVLLELSTDKETYDLTDTIRLTLHEYSKFSKTDRSPAKKRELTKEDLENAMNLTIKIEDFVGNENLEKYLDDYFKDINFDWNPLNANQQLVKKDKEIYLKAFVFEFKMLAKKKGSYVFEPSAYDYMIYTNNDVYFDGFKPTGNGSYTIDRSDLKPHFVKSNQVEIRVK